MQQAMAWESLTNALMMVTPQSVAEVIYVACLDPFPRYRYLVATPLMHFLFALLKFLPTCLADRLSLNL
jgi:hypothetical protein